MKKIIAVLLFNLFYIASILAQTPSTFVSLDGSTTFAATPKGMMNGLTNFTIETWIKTTENKSNSTFWQNPTIIGNGRGASADNDLQIVSSNGKAGLFTGIGNENSLLSNATINDNNWHHIAVVKNGATLTLFVDGVSQGNLAVSAGGGLITTDAPLAIGGVAFNFNVSGNNTVGVNCFHQGQYAETRFSNNARYTNNFAPSSSFISDSNTVALYHYGSCQHEICTDASSNTNFLSGKFSAPSCANTLPFNKAINYNGINQSAYLPQSIAMNNVINFTIEGWIKSTDMRTSPTSEMWRAPWIFGKEMPNGNSGDIMITTQAGYVSFNEEFTNGGGYTQQLTKYFVCDNQWHHIAVSADGITCRYFIDGMLQGSKAVANGLQLSGTYNLCLMNRNGTDESVHSGLLDEFRFSNTARYTSNFIPSITPFTNDTNTVVLYHSDDCPNNNTLTDASTNNYTATLNNYFGGCGGAVTKTGSGDAISFNGSSTYISTTDYLIPTGDFTVDFWVTASVVQGGFHEFISQGTSGAAFYIGTTTSGEIRCGDTWPSTGVMMPLFRWVHLAIVKSGTNGTLYMDGIQVATTTNYSINATGSTTTIGRQYSTYGEYAYGGLDEIRIWNSALTQTQIRERMCKKIKSSDDLYNNLLVNYDFDESIYIATVYNKVNETSYYGIIHGGSRINSGAAIGDVSNFSYSGPSSVISIMNPNRGDSLTATLSGANAQGMQVYCVTERPNYFYGIGADTIPNNDGYFGVLPIGSPYTYAYTSCNIEYNYHGIQNIINESNLKLFKRDFSGWSSTNAIADTALNKCSLLHNAYNTEFLIGESHIIHTFYHDVDGDTYGNPADSVVAYIAPANYVENHLDCNDNDSLVTLFCNTMTTDGSSTFASTPKGMMNGLTNFTIETWIKTTENRTHSAYWEKPTIIGNARGSSPDGDFGITTNNGMVGMWSGIGAENAIQTNIAINDNQWHHVAAVKDGSLLTLFVDGINGGSIAVGVGASSESSDASLVIGGSALNFGWGGSNTVNVNHFHQGQFAETRFSSNARYTSNFTPNTSLVSDANTVALYHYGICQREICTDASSNNNCLSGKFTTPTCTNTLPFTKAINYNGVNQSVFLPTGIMNNLTNFTIEGWIKSSDMRTSPTGQIYNAPWIFGKEHPAGNSGDLIVTTVAGYASFTEEFVGGPTYTENKSNYFISDNQWHHVAVSADGTTCRFFIDGMMQLSRPVFNGLAVSNSDRFCLMARSGTNESTHSGLLEEVRFSNTGRYVSNFIPSTTPFTNDVNTVALYHSDDCPNGSILSDASTNANHAALNNFNGSCEGPATKPGSGNAISFDGVNDYVEVTNNSTMNIGNTFTIEYWINPSDAGGSNGRVIFNKENSIEMAIIDGTLKYALWTNTPWFWVDVAPLPLNQWTHIAFIYNGSEAKAYMNGILVHTQLFSGNVNLSSYNLRLGHRSDSPQPLYQGKMDEFVFWNTALTQTQIRDRMCRKIESNDPLYNNLIAYYNFDESAGNTVFNKINETNNYGVLMNGPTRVTSEAPIGNVSTHAYVGATSSITLAHPTRGDTITASLTSGNADGVQVYCVTERPNTFRGTDSGLNNQGYFGVFAINGSNVQHTAFYNYDGIPNIVDENNLNLYKRNSNADTSWINTQSIVNTITNIFNTSGSNAEYLIMENIARTYYHDIDGDSYGNLSDSLIAFTQPANYVLNHLDCNDMDSLEHPGQIWYIDNDGDHYGTGISIIQCARPLHGYIASELTITGDCDDNNAKIYPGVIDAFEYFIGTDPGVGNGTSIPYTINNPDSVSFMAGIAIPIMPVGNYYLAVRAHGCGTGWGLFDQNLITVLPPVAEFYPIVAAEYFFDTDPGLGNGIPLSLQAADSLQINTSIVLPYNLIPGFHEFAIRVKNAIGDWSLFEQRLLNISEQKLGYNPIVAAEYFADADPGLGNGTPIPITVADTIDQHIIFNLPSNLLVGNHKIAFRVKDLSGHWSLFELPGITINVKVFLQGYYVGNSAMTPAIFNEGQSNPITDVDTIFVDVHSSDPPYNLIYTAQGLLDVNGNTSVVLPNYTLGINHYLAIRHRNSITTWSANPISITTDTEYDFSSSSSQAYGNNMIEVDPGVWALYTGDINADENIDLLDISYLETDIDGFAYGYFATDLNGDGNVDLLDSPIIEANIDSFIYSNHP